VVGKLNFNLLLDPRIGVTRLITAGGEHPEVDPELFILVRGTKHDRPGIVDAQLPAGPMLSLVSPFEVFLDPWRQVAFGDVQLVPADRFTRTTKTLALEAGVRPLTPHPAARHTWATLALSSGIPAKVVQERLGHSSVAITLDRYSHMIEGMDRDAAERVASLFR
jgi:Phage integrase family